MKRTDRSAYELEELMGLSERARLADNEQVKREIWHAVSSGNPAMVEMVKRKLLARAARVIMSGHKYYVPANPEEVAGALEFGTEVYTGYPVGVNSNEGHFLLTGATRAGKTNLALLILARLEGRVPFWAFDPKRDARHLLRVRRDVYPLRLDEGLKFNPLRPCSEIPPKRWYQVFYDIFCQDEDLLSGSKAYGLELFDELDARGYKPAPTVFHYADLVRQEGKRLRPSSVRGKYNERLLTRLESLLSVFGEVYDCAAGMPLQDLVAENIIFETDSLDTAAAQLQIRLLLHSNFCH